jgi:acetyl-CoA acetyltransferase
VRDVYVIDALRTPIGRYGGALANARPDDLVAHVIAAAVERNALPPAEVDEVYMGCTNQAGEDNRNVARMGLLLAGLPVEVPGVTVNRLCASGLEAVTQGARQVMCGDADLVLAGGVESMTRAPLVTAKPDRSFPRGNPVLHDTTIGWRFTNPRMEELGHTESMGETAENVAERYSRATGARLRPSRRAASTRRSCRCLCRSRRATPSRSTRTRARGRTPLSSASQSCGRCSAKAGR